ncbi:DUF6049 family protein [Streptomyces turgidiscabies]|uniref:Uncharacterized protein n=1 Tax=Streptomyces turgidiscabies (strain Car8) TaxID=698760 RepID=L7FGV6_STRT8|nr:MULTISPECIES: DUF6049 family protein [Streptomyces]ELP70306.1 hypothetical protein STRTUCAR8_05633 [Streptomyces turgidiscabies Car8]MDX3492060.1 DUF6049 family protein [Streptomyces turgidiscabies]GAQ69576.1 hypothetical protein T45_01304 [Streptomyces turgidiscabies]
MAEAADFPGLTPSLARRWFRRAGVLLTGAPLLAGLLQLPAGQPAYAAGSDPVVVSLDSLTPSAPTDGDTLTVSGTVTNKGKKAVTDAHVDLRVGQLLTTRSGIDDVAARTDYVSGADGTEVGGKYVEKFSKLTPGVAQPFTISVPVDKLDLGQDGVYQIGVSLSGETATAPYEQVLGIQRTFLPWQPEEADARTRTTYLWPLISTVHMTAETGPGEQQTPVFLNDDLAAEISPGGRLEQMLSLGKGLDVTWVIDPDLLASVDAMIGSYGIQGADGTSTPGTGQTVAKQWLAELQDAVEGKEVVALPFGDPDLASIAHNGKNVTGTLSHLKSATDVATDTVETILHVTPSTDFAWPVNGAVDPSIVKIATSAGADKVIARSDSLKETGDLPYTPSAARPIGGGTTAVVADTRLSTAFQGDMTRAGSSTLAVQKFLATSLTTTLQTDKQRTVVVAPQRMPSASQAQTMEKAITALQDSNWSQSQELTAAADTKPDPGATTKVPPTSSYAATLRRQQLPQSAFSQIATTQGKLDNFKIILTDKTRVETPFGRAINREMATSWRGRSGEAIGFRRGVESHLNALTDQVKLIEKSETKLSGGSATIPVTVQNNLVQPVDNLVLRVTSTNPTRLKIGDDDYQEQSVAVTGGHSQSVKFTTSSNANGPITVIAQLYTKDGQKYGPAVSFDVRVTEFTAMAMLVIGGGFLLLVLAGLRMYTQRKRAAARQAEESDNGHENEDGATDDTVGADGAHDADESRPQGEPDATVPEDGPEQPSDPPPNTAPESADPSGTGERVDR